MSNFEVSNYNADKAVNNSETYQSNDKAHSVILLSPLPAGAFESNDLCVMTMITRADW